ncbi:hypothetical protein JKF63_04943 [Porcisia hertigi]|uniref:Uncharacterized protein n=1 Tax=Porcisia hertigi TaxID=2761500 RepID=A0A836IRU9_9TRYP|nr:hypothetical protein JKF63_04943 [Porcisia hertigi]
MSASSVAGCKRVCIFLDCRVLGDGKGYEDLRQTVYSQCSQLRALSHHHSLGDAPASSVTVHFVRHTRVESGATSFHVTASDQPTNSAALDVENCLRALAVAQPDHSVDACGMTTFGNRMSPVMPHVQRALDKFQQDSQLILFCSSYVSHSEATQSLSGLCLDASPHQWLRCILVDWEAACVTVGEMSSSVRVYRCSRSTRQLQAALQDGLGSFLLPSVYSSRHLQLQVGLQVVPVAASIWHYGAFLNKCRTISSVPGVSRVLPDLPVTRDMKRRHFADTAHCHPLISVGPAVERSCRDERPTLHLRAVLEADKIDESFLFGDTWVLTLDLSTSFTSTLSSSSPSKSCAASAASLWHAFFDVFRGDALVFAAEDTGIEVCNTAMLRHHHFVAYFMPDKTMRVREIVPPELRFVPLPAPPTREGLREQGVYPPEMQRLRQQLVSHCASASFSLDALLSNE